MLIHKYFDSLCDSCDSPFHGVGAAALAQGATGRWCEVLWLCSRCASKMCPSDEIMSPEYAAHLISQMPQPSWPDFPYDASVSPFEPLFEEEATLFLSGHSLRADADDISLYPEYEVSSNDQQ